VKPAVDRLETALKPEISVLRLNLRSELGRKYARLYGVQTVPTFVVLSPSGEVVGRFHLDVPRVDEVMLLVSGR
jgi:hypothetical protein